MFKPLIIRFFGQKLPCGHGKRVRGIGGDRVTCQFCGRHYLLAKFLSGKGKMEKTK